MTDRQAERHTDGHKDGGTYRRTYGRTKISIYRVASLLKRKGKLLDRYERKRQIRDKKNSIKKGEGIIKESRNTREFLI